MDRALLFVSTLSVSLSNHYLSLSISNTHANCFSLILCVPLWDNAHENTNTNTPSSSQFDLFMAHAEIDQVTVVQRGFLPSLTLSLTNRKVQYEKVCV